MHGASKLCSLFFCMKTWKSCNKKKKKRKRKMKYRIISPNYLQPSHSCKYWFVTFPHTSIVPKCMSKTLLLSVIKHQQQVENFTTSPNSFSKYTEGFPIFLQPAMFIHSFKHRKASPEYSPKSYSRLMKGLPM